MNCALPAPATGYAPPPAGLTLSAVEATALPTDEALMLAWAGGDL
ncbi:MAG TPA: RNA polymerase subunit sigma, partial [Stenotrophomonas sp.]|nr:RNA polymerase subunit sigma [Stenotrophomonas sp.]